MGLGLAVAIFASVAVWVPVCAARGQEAGSRVVGGLIYHNSRAFRIPFKIDETDRTRIQEVRLYVSSDLGQSWALAGKVSAQEMAFTFRSERDAEYWFTVRTLDTRGRLFPPDDAPVEPNMRVVVDTTPPTLVLASLGRRGRTGQGALGNHRREPESPAAWLCSTGLKVPVTGGRYRSRSPA